MLFGFHGMAFSGGGTMGGFGMGSTVFATMGTAVLGTVLVEHFGLFVGLLFTAERCDQGDHQGGKSERLFHVGFDGGKERWGMGVATGNAPVREDSAEIHEVQHHIDEGAGD